MSAQRATAEKSMEEILASIRETIEQDIETKPQGVHMSQEKENNNSDDVFELTQVINDDGTISDVLETSSECSHEKNSSENTESKKEELSFQEHLSTLTKDDSPSIEAKDYAADNDLSRQTINDVLDQVTENEVNQDDHQFTNEKPSLQKSDSIQSSSPHEQEKETTMSSAEPQYTSEESVTATPEDLHTSENHSIDAEEIESEALSTDSAELISNSVAAATNNALSELSEAVTVASISSQEEPSAPQLTTETLGNNTVEGLMRDLLKPMLKDWLDAHLPSLVKWIVTEQIEKIIQEKKKDI